MFPNFQPELTADHLETGSSVARDRDFITPMRKGNLREPLDRSRVGLLYAAIIQWKWWSFRFGRALKYFKTLQCLSANWHLWCFSWRRLRITLICLLNTLWQRIGFNFMRGSPIEATALIKMQ